MTDTFYVKEDNVDISYTSYYSKLITVKTELKNLTFNLSVVKFLKTSDFLEKITEREVFSSKNLDNKTALNTTVSPISSDSERVELHLTLFDEHLNSKYFYFDLGKKWSGGGKFYIRDLMD